MDKNYIDFLANPIVGLSWPVWLSWLGIIPQSEKLLVQFPVGSRALGAGSIPGQDAYKRQVIDVSLVHSGSLPLFLSPFPSL